MYEDSKNRLRATHVAIIKNMKQDVSTRRSLSTAGYKVRSNREVIGFIKEVTAVDKDLRVEMSCFIFLIIATCVVRKLFLLFI